MTTEETYTLELTRRELIAINRGLNLWLSELRQSIGRGVDSQKTYDIASGVLNQVDTILGIKPE